jgi:hypothetical protein
LALTPHRGTAALGELLRRATSDDSAAVVVGASLLAPVLDATLSEMFKEPSVKAQLEGMRSDPAWSDVRERMEKKRKSPNWRTFVPGNQHRKLSETEAEQQEIVAIQDKARTSMDESMPLEAFNQLCDQLAAEIKPQLKKLAETRKPKGSRFVIAVGTFQYVPRAGGVADAKLERALKKVTFRLKQEDEISQKFDLIAYDVTKAEELIKEIGGDSDMWLREDGSGHLSVAVRDYHPDDIFVLTGSMNEQLEKGYKMTYDVACEVTHPRKRITEVSVESAMANYYHPTRGWISEQEDKKIGAEKKS